MLSESCQSALFPSSKPEPQGSAACPHPWFPEEPDKVHATHHETKILLCILSLKNVAK